MGVLEKVKKSRSGDQPDPFRAMNYVVEKLVEPDGLALYTLSELRDGEIRAIAMLLSIDELLRREMGWQQPTVLRTSVEYMMLLRSSKRRRRLKEIISVIRAGRGQAQVPVMMKPVKRIMYGEETD